MSMVVFLIAVVPAIGVVAVAEKTKNRGAVVVAALAAATLGVVTGSPAYMGIDLLCVGIATWISWEITKKKTIYRTPEEIAAAQEAARLERIKAQEAEIKRNKAITEFFQTALVLGAVALFLFWKFWEPATPQPVTAQPQPQQVVAQPAPGVTAPPKAKKESSAHQSSAHHQKMNKTPPANKVADKVSVGQCLAIADEQAMVRCLERAE